MNDDRPRRAIEAGRAWVRGEIAIGEARAAAFATHAAARETNQEAACAAARSAGQAAATACAASSADSGAHAARERQWQYQRLLDPGGQT